MQIGKIDSVWRYPVKGMRGEAATDHAGLGVTVNRKIAIASLALFFLLLFGLPILAKVFPSQTIALVDSFYRAGSLVFGGGHVVLPLLQSEVVPQGWVSNDAFLAGYGATQAVPGPLFTFAAYLGTVMNLPPNNIAGAIICLLAIFASSVWRWQHSLCWFFGRPPPGSW